LNKIRKKKLKKFFFLFFFFINLLLYFFFKLNIIKININNQYFYNFYNCFRNAKGNDINVSCDADTYETYTNYCELKFKKQKKNFPYIIGSSLILICMIIFLILIILDNKKKRKLSEKNESNDDLLEINVQENSFKVGKCYIAGSNYIPRKVDEITISANDRISIIEVLDNGRANGKNLNTQQSGIFPLSCLKSEIIVQNKEIRTNQNSIYCLSITIVLCAIVFFINC